MKMQAELVERQLLKAGHHTFGKQVGKINKSVQRLSSLTHRLLEMSQMQQDDLILRKSKFFLSKLIEEKADVFRSVSHHVIEVQGQTPLEVYGDRFWIGQVRPICSKTLSSTLRADRIIVRYGEKPGKVEVSVTDFGVGVSKEDQQRIFERFFKGSDNSKNTYPGFGIGSYIFRQIIERHGGGVWVDDNPEGGSVFSFSLPTDDQHKDRQVNMT